MAQYTNPSGTSGATLTTGELVNSTIANIGTTGEDAYARVLTLKTNASASDITIVASGSAFVSGAKVVVDGFTMTNGGATPLMRVSGGATVKNGTTDGTVSLYIYGGSAVNVDMGAGGYWNVNTNGVVDGGSFNGTRLGIGGTTKGTVKNLVIKKTAAGDGSNCVQKNGELIDCTISQGALFRVSGGQAVRTIVSGANARLVVSTGSANSTMLYADGSATVIGGTATDTITSGGTLFVSSNGTADGVSVFTGGRLVAYSGATVTGVAESGGYVSVAKGAAVTFVETDLTGFTFTRNATVHESTTAKNVTVADGAILMVCASSGTALGHGTVDGATIQAGGSMSFEEGVWAWGTGNWASACNVTVEAGGTLRLRNFAKALDVQAGAGAILTRESNRSVIGGENTNIAKGVVVDRETLSINEFGDDFEVVNGVATGLYLTGDTTTARSAGDFTDGITVKDAVVVSGGSLYLYNGAKIDGIDVYGVNGTAKAQLTMYDVIGGGIRIGSGGSAGATNANATTVLDGIDVFSGGSMSINNGSATNVTVSSGGSITIANGTHGSATVGQDGILNFNGGTAEKLTVDGIGSDTTRLNVNGGTVDTVNVKKGGLVIGGKNTVVSSLEVDGANKIWISSGATVKGGYTKGSYELRLEAGGGTLTDFTVGKDTYVYFSAGLVSGVTFASNAGKLRLWGSNAAALTIESCYIYRKMDASDNRGLRQGRMVDCLIASGGYLRQEGGSNTGLTLSSGTLDMSGGFLSSAMVQSGGVLLLSAGTVRDIALSGYTATATVFDGVTVSGATIEDYAVIQVNAGAALYDPILRMNTPSTIANKYARINIGTTGVEGGVVSGGSIAGNGNTIEFYMYSGGVASDVTFDRGTYIGAYSSTVVSGGTLKAGTLSMRGGTARGLDVTGGTVQFNATAGTLDGITVRGSGIVNATVAAAVISGNTFVSGGVMNVTAAVQTVDNVVADGGTINVSNGGNITGTIIRDGGMMVMSSGATITDTTISSGGYLEAAGKAKSGVVNGLTMLSGGKFLLTANSASVTGLNAEAGAVISLSFTNATAATAAAFDTLADCNTTIELLNVGTATKTFNVATTGNTNQQFAMVGSGIFEGTFKAGDTYVDPFTCQQLVVAADATTIDVTSYTRTETAQAVGFATSGATINNGKDKELMWNGATVSGAVKLIDADAAAAITGDAWMDIRACSVDPAGAAIYGTDVNVDFNGKVRYQLHGGGDTVGNLAAGANYGGSVKGVEILSYNTTYTGVGYAGGFGDVDGEIDVIFAGGNSLNKDFYAGALYNANKVAANTTTSVGDIKTTFGEKAADSISVKGNVYGASAVKAGTVTTAATLHTVGDVELTLKAGSLTDGKCVFAGGYATGHDEAKTVPVYTVESVTVTVTGGSWGLTHGGRGIFGGAFASDNIVDGEEAAGVYAQVGDVNMTITGGTMGNVYGGGWAQKGAKSEVGNVNISISGGTLTNVFGGGSTSSSGGSTVAGNVTITVSGGTINGAIYARGQFATDATGTASVVFTGNKAFSCGVYGYSNVSGAEADGAMLSFTGYTGSFSGKVGGFDSIMLGGATAMTLGTAYGDVSNTAWTFDAAARDVTLAGTAFLNWSDADFTGDTITLNQASGDAVAWDLVSADTGTVYNKFDVRIDGQSILSETIDIDDVIAGTGTAYDGWGFTDENGTLKFKRLA